MTHDLDVKRTRGLEPKLSPAMKQLSGMVMVVVNEFQSQPYLTISHTNDQALQGSS